MNKAIPEQKPIMIQFATAQAALAHKGECGGWVFVSDGAANALWFDAEVMTPGAIMRHPATNGQSGRLL